MSHEKISRRLDDIKRNSRTFMEDFYSMALFEEFKLEPVTHVSVNTGRELN